MTDHVLLVNYAISCVIYFLQVALFGYLELKYNSGLYAAGILAFLLVWKKKIYWGLLIVALEAFAYETDHKKISYICFMVLMYMYISHPDPVSGADIESSDEVAFRPYEVEIRKYLMQKDPSLLHKVDDYLTKYQGREDELLGRLKSKYEIKEHTEQSRTPRSQPLAASRPTNQTPNSGGWGSIFSPSTEYKQSPDTFHSSDDESEEEEDEPPVRLTREEMLENAKRRARENMARRVEARINRR